MNLKVYFLTVLGSTLFLLTASSILVLTNVRFRLPDFPTHERSVQNSAINREKQLKHWNRKWKLRLIEESNPNWKDLYNLIN